LRATLLRASFEALYRWGPAIYDPFTSVMFAGEWDRWQRLALVFVPPGACVVELGCGTGRLAAAAAREGIHWVAIDRSEAMIRQARNRVGPQGPLLVCADARRLPLRHASAGAIVSTFPAPFIQEHTTANEIRRVLRPGGRVVVVVSAHLTPVDLRHRLCAWAIRLIIGHQRVTEPAFHIPGLVGRIQRVPTPGGWADVYIAE